MYSAKLLLFGEHILLLGAPAVAVPVPAFGGQWAWHNTPVVSSPLLVFVENLEAICPQIIDTQKFAQEIAAGLFFKSNIPMGYGLGSSGALCAAVYDRFSWEKTDSFSELQAIFAKMEGFFHGHSSGIDPLTSYLNQPLLIENKTEVAPVMPAAWSEPPVVFLLDSQLPRQTGPLVQWFLEQSQQPDWRADLQHKLLPAHQVMVQGWLQAQPAVFWPALRQVSRFQFAHFHPMVPVTLRDIWQQSFEKQSITFKICGAGGGGFLLGFAPDQAAIDLLSPAYPVVFPFAKQTPLAHEN